MIARYRAWRLLLSIVAGLSLALAFPNYDLPFFGWISVAGLIIASLGASLPQAALCGFIYGAAFYTFSIPWIYTVMRQYGPLPVWQAAGVLALLVTQQSLLYIVFTVPLAWMARRERRIALVAAPFLWVAVELLRSRLGDLSFPWNLLGYIAAGNVALMQVASLAGIFGLSFLMAAYNALLAGLVLWFWPAESWPQRLPSRPLSGDEPRRPRQSLVPVLWLGFTAALIAVVAFGGRFVPRQEPTAVAHLVQTDLPTTEDIPANWDQIHAGDMAQLDRISITAGEKQPGLIVWPEVPAPFSLQQASFARRAIDIAHESQSDFLLGVVDWKPLTPSADDGRRAPYNSAALLDPAGREEFLYDKIHLVPFSEYVPGRSFLWFAKDLTALAGDFHHGTRYAVGELPGGRFGVFICYEAIFPNEVRRFALNGAELLINISNDGWLGRSAGPAQSLVMARVRAVENRRWLLRDTNNGFTASIDPYGRVVAILGTDIRGELDAPYGFRGDLTLYTRWGDWIAWASVAIGGVLLLFCGMGLVSARPSPEPAQPQRHRHSKRKK